MQASHVWCYFFKHRQQWVQKTKVSVGQSISETDVELWTCTDCHPRASRWPLTTHQNKPLTVQKICTVPFGRGWLGRVCWRGFYDINNSDHTEGNRLVSCVLVKNAFKVETPTTFERGPPQAIFDLPEKRGRWGDCLGKFVILSLKYANLLIQAQLLYYHYKSCSEHRSRRA